MLIQKLKRQLNTFIYSDAYYTQTSEINGKIVEKNDFFMKSKSDILQMRALEVLNARTAFQPGDQNSLVKNFYVHKKY